MSCALRTVALIAILLVTACASATSRPADGNASPEDTIGYACDEATDCAVKDVGGCCGYTPACVNRDSPTHPDRVVAECRKHGRAGICGFPVITGCSCEQHRCAAIHGTPPPGAKSSKR